MNDLALRASLEQICRDRSLAADLYREAHAKLLEARKVAARAECAGGDFSHLGDEVLKRLGAVNDGGDGFVAQAIRLLDQRVWAYVIEHSGIERLMDHKARTELRRQLHEDPPAVTPETVRATIEGFMADAGMIFQRGIAEAFTSLDRRFRSHDGFKIGARVILDGAFDIYGSWGHYRRKDETLRDIERTFMVLDGKGQPERYVGIVGLIDEAKRVPRSLEMNPFEVENEYFRVRGFKNGNAHVWFLRPDLVERVNKLLAEYYGEVLADGRPEDDGGLHRAKTTPAKNFGLFVTPPAVVGRVIEDCRLWRHAGEPPLYLLEPSAGTGALALAAAAAGACVDCVEIQPHLAHALRATGQLGDVLQADFLAVDPPAMLYDRVLMNPPFDRERDIDHVMHALKFLKPGGALVAIMSAGTQWRETRKSEAFRAHVERLGGRFYDLPIGSFAPSGTNVNTCVLTIGASRR